MKKLLCLQWHEQQNNVVLDCIHSINKCLEFTLCNKSLDTLVWKKELLTCFLFQVLRVEICSSAGSAVWKDYGVFRGGPECRIPCLIPVLLCFMLHHDENSLHPRLPIWTESLTKSSLPRWTECLWYWAPNKSLPLKLFCLVLWVQQCKGN